MPYGERTEGYRPGKPREQRAGLVGGRVEVSGHGQAEANERQESCDGMDDEDR
jgi:hypothetical protein